MQAVETTVCGAQGPPARQQQQQHAAAHGQREFGRLAAGRLGKAALRLGKAGYARLHGGRVVQQDARRPMTRHRKRRPRGVREGLTGQDSRRTWADQAASWLVLTLPEDEDSSRVGQFGLGVENAGPLDLLICGREPIRSAASSSQETQEHAGRRSVLAALLPLWCMRFESTGNRLNLLSDQKIQSSSAIAEKPAKIKSPSSQNARMLLHRYGPHAPPAGRPRSPSRRRKSQPSPRFRS